MGTTEFDGVKGFLPQEEALQLLEWASQGALIGPLLEIGSYCGLSTLWLAKAARAAANQAGDTKGAEEAAVKAGVEAGKSASKPAVMLKPSGALFNASNALVMPPVPPVNVLANVDFAP